MTNLQLYCVICWTLKPLTDGKLNLGSFIVKGNSVCGEHITDDLERVRDGVRRELQDRKYREAARTS